MKRPNVLPVLVALSATLWLSGCSKDWPAFRQNVLRTGGQLQSSSLSNPARIGSLAVRWTFTQAGLGPFRASPVVYHRRVYIGNSNGFFYALNAHTGTLVWKYPPGPTTTLTSAFTCNPSSVGIASSAIVSTVNGRTAVIFGAPDRSFGGHLGDGRLFALDADTGAEIWKSPTPIARLTGTTFGNATELHEQIGYSSPLVFGNHVFVGIGDHCDSPIQKGRVVAVNLSTGAIDPAFSYCSTGTCADNTRGGGVWSQIAGWLDGIYVTTGNTHSGGPTEPVPNHGLSLLRLNPNTGAIVWKFQPVPWVLDNDPDWSANPTVMPSSCATLIVSTQKDGWTHALNATSAAKQWSYPPHVTPFTPTDGTLHGDTRYMKGGAVWNDVYIAMNGGLNLPMSGVSGGYGRLHAFNVCAAEADRLRWIVDVPNTSPVTYRLGPPSVTGGMVFVGTDQGHLVAIADPSIAPAAGSRCSNPDVSTPNCVASGYALTTDPAVLANVALDGSMVYNEPAIARGRVYVSTAAGKVYMLSTN